jgi:hypothetical protein
VRPTSALLDHKFILAPLDLVVQTTISRDVVGESTTPPPAMKVQVDITTVDLKFCDYQVVRFFFILMKPDFN